MTITKLLLLVVGVFAQEYGATPPNIRPPNEQLREQVSSEIVIPRILVFVRGTVRAWALLEAAVLVALTPYTPSALARSFLHSLYLLPSTSRPDPTLAAPTPVFVLGTLLALAGTTLRAHCYHALGRHFTFELAIRPAHVLVTDGVYGVVRHPSYTGIAGLAIGWMLCVLDPRGTVMRVVLNATRGWGYHDWAPADANAALTALLACTWATGLAVLFAGMRMRMDREDAMLEENFGGAWREWARRVPCRVIPGVY